MKKVLTLSLSVILSLSIGQTALAEKKPCLKTVSIDDKIVRLSIPMTPVRGVNLIFPFDIVDTKASYSLSSNQVFQFKKAGNSRVVPLAFARVNAEFFGTAADLTISQDDFIFSMELVQSKVGHCSNIKFELSPNMVAVLEQEQNERRGRVPGELTGSDLDKIEQKVNDQLLTKLGDIVTAKKKTFKIREENKLRVSKNEEAIIYVSKVERHGDFYLIFAEIENRTSSGRNLLINNIQVLGDSGLVVQGYSSNKPQMSGDSVQRFTFSTLTKIPKTGLTLKAFTDLGELEVKW